MKYYPLTDGKLIATSSRGVFEIVDEDWLPVEGDCLETMAMLSREMTFEEALKYAKQENLVKEHKPANVIADQLTMRNDEFENEHMEGEEYFPRIPTIRYLLDGHSIYFESPVTFLVGENGTGKSTLLEAVAVGFGLNAEGGSRESEFETKRTHSDLYKLVALSRIRPPEDAFFLRAESFYNLASNIDDVTDKDLVGRERRGKYGGKSLHAQSHGESFMALVKNRFQGNGLYLLDEPEAALSPRRQLELMKEMKRLTDRGAQFIIATHSPILMTFPEAGIYECSVSGIEEKRYEEMDHFTFTRDYLADPDKYLKEIFEDNYEGGEKC